MAKKRTSGAQNRKILKIKITKEDELKKKIPHGIQNKIVFEIML